MRFKTFLEAAKGGAPRYRQVEVNHAIQLLNTEFSDSRWMLFEDRSFYRGDKAKLPAGASVVDTTATERVSQNTTNYYTAIFDNHPEMKDFPKRSHSFICTTDPGYAYQFSGSSGPNIIIPSNEAKIGVCHAGDLWDLNIKMFGGVEGISIWNRTFNGLGVKPTFSGIKAFCEKIKTDDDLLFELYKDSAVKFSRSKLEKCRDKVFDIIMDAYAPDKTKMKAYTPATLPHKLKGTEAWIGGKVLVIDIDLWKKLLEHIKNGGTY